MHMAAKTTAMDTVIDLTSPPSRKVQLVIAG